MTQSGRRKIDPSIYYRMNKWDELAAYLTRAVVIGGLSWLIWTTNNNTTTLQLLEWRTMQLELAIHLQGAK